MQGGNKRETVIGVVLEDIYTDFSKELIQSILKAVPDNKNVRLVVLAGKYDHGDSSYIEHVYKTVYNSIFRLSEMCDLDGLIIHLGSVGSQRGEMIVEKQLERYKSIPKIFIACDAPELTTVNYDNETGIREAVDTLVNVNGLTKLCMLGGRDDNTDAQLRKEIFASCLKDNGISFGEKNYVSSSMSVNTESEAAQLLDNNPDAQAIFCVNDASAKGLYSVMEQRGLVPGRDILVFGFDNTKMAGEMIPSLSSVGLADCTLGQKALELLLAKLGGEEISSATVPTRLYGRESFPHEMYDYTTLEVHNPKPEFIYRMFDDCFYRYKSETISRESVDLKRLFYEIISRMLAAVKKRYMSVEDFEKLCVMIDKFFEKGAMQYTDAVKLIKSIDRLHKSVILAQGTSATNVFVNRLFMRIKDCSVLALSEQNIQDNENFISSREKIQQFLIEGTVYAGRPQDDLNNIVRNIDKLGIRNAAFYMYDEPVAYNSAAPMFPETVRLRCVIKSGELYTLPKERQRSSTNQMFKRAELPGKCKGFVALPVFYRDLIYGVFLCELTKDIYNRGEYLAVQLGRTVYLNDEKSVVKLVNTDMLTGLYNRRYFYNYLGSMLSSTLIDNFCLLYLDLDNFKAVNDSFGHNAGDEVLIKTAELIKEHFPGSVIARLGGDEFAVIDHCADENKVASRCESLEKAVEQAFEKYGCGTAVSIGVVFSDGSTDDVDKLLQKSDVKMYSEKKVHHGQTV